MRDRLLAVEDDKKKGEALVAPTHRLKSFLSGQNEDRADQPIADFFPHCTGKWFVAYASSPFHSRHVSSCPCRSGPQVMFADLAGFTAWSSTREPTQVFLLLQTLYQNFDLIAKRRRVFKVETIGTNNALELYAVFILAVMITHICTISFDLR